MISTQELRIGNWVDAPDGQKTVKTIYHGAISDVEHVYNEMQIMGIPLTPEWLKRFGFELDHMGKRPYRIEIPEVCTLSATQNGFSDTGAWWLSMKSQFYSQPVTIIAHHIHELQNLYRVIAGKELELKPKE